MKQTGNGYRSTSGPSSLKTYSSIACNMTLIHDKCAVGWTTLGRNLVNLNQTHIKPKPHIWPQNFGNLKKVNKNRYHEKCNHYNQNKWCPITTRVSTKTIHTVRDAYVTTMTVLLMWQTEHFVLCRCQRTYSHFKTKHTVILKPNP